ncbi:NAD synthetase [Thermocoleostomius sinensis]|nr:NAD synthetase [Thermocoleostomius sinensis]
MEPIGWIDWLAGMLAIMILASGLVMLLKGVSAMNRN